MLFGTGMGIGLVFWSVAEPLSHYISPMAGIEPGTPEAVAFAMRSCFMHWGLHPWACYAVMGLVLAYFQFRR
jgi:glycine betaine transporter